MFQDVVEKEGYAVLLSLHANRMSGRAIGDAVSKMQKESISNSKLVTLAAASNGKQHATLYHH